MQNGLTDLLKVDVPVIGGPMAKASEADLCAAVARAGGIGFIGAGYMSAERLSQVFTEAWQQVQSSDIRHSAVGIGLMNYSCSEVRD